MRLDARWIAVAYWAILMTAAALYYSASSEWYSPLLLMVLAVTVFTLGTVLASSKDRLGSRVSQIITRPLFLSRFVWLGSLANIAALAVVMQNLQVSVSSVLSLQGLFAVSNATAVSRYGGDVYTSPVTSLLLGIGYAAAIVAPFACAGRRSRLLLIVPPISAMPYAAVTTERLGLLISSALVVGGLISFHVWQTGKNPKIRGRNVLAVVVAVTLVGAAFTAIAFLRVGSLDPQKQSIVLRKQVTYAMGSVPAFVQWYDKSLFGSDGLVQNPSLGFGSASMAGVGSLVGSDRSSYRAYDYFEVIDGRGSQTNVYTIFRGLILDFSVIGAIIVCFGLGLCFGAAYRGARRGNAAQAAALSCGLAMVFLSNTMAITSFSNVVIGMLLGVLVVAHSCSSSVEESSAADRGHRVRLRSRHVSV